jgi:hypothetical protein
MILVTVTPYGGKKGLTVCMEMQCDLCKGVPGPKLFQETDVIQALCVFESQGWSLGDCQVCPECRGQASGQGYL